MIADKIKWYRNYERFGYCLGAILLHLILAIMLASFVIWKAALPPPADTFFKVSIPAPPPPPALPAAASGAPSSSQLEPTDTVVSPSTPLSMVTTMAASNFAVDSQKVLDQTLSHLSDHLPTGSSLAGHGAGDGSGGTGSSYGTSSSKSGDFQGNIYDLKRAVDGSATDIAEGKVEAQSSEDQLDPAWDKSVATQRGLELLRRFVKTWDPQVLASYYKGPETLHATQICIPQSKSALAPEAFGLAGKMRARRWIAIYSASFTPTDSGRYRFVGIGDDFMVVQFDGENVLDACLSGEELCPQVNGHDDVGPYHCSQWLQMQARVPSKLQVLIGEGPGGLSGFVLMLQKEGDNSAKGDYPIFQLKAAPVPADAIFPPSRKTIVFPSS